MSVLLNMVLKLEKTRKNPDRKALVKLRISNHCTNLRSKPVDMKQSLGVIDFALFVVSIISKMKFIFLFHCPNYSSIRDGLYNENR